jgi:hypothetical protein
MLKGKDISAGVVHEGQNQLVSFIFILVFLRTLATCHTGSLNNYGKLLLYSGEEGKYLSSRHSSYS